ncbi:uncharacterized protein LOC135485176 [Lineus longissimus]|uniref:uncharacterized protein LOC135485176 n=1 Tax=Lineus longissimus TaxID=88925 RepID=UPI002B4E2065
MKPKRRTKTTQNSRYRYGTATSSSSEMSGAEEGSLGKNVGKDEKDTGFSKTKMAINKLSQQYLTRESSGCEADTENSTAESGQYDFEAAENNFTLCLSPTKKKNKKPKKQPKKKGNAKGKKQNKMDTENDQKLKRKFSALGISDSENSVNILSDKPVESKKARPSVVTFCLKDVENMDFDSPFQSNAGSNESKGSSLFISPIGHVGAITEPDTFKMMRFTSIKETSTPAESKPVVDSASSDGCFGFDSIMTPEPEVSPVRKISSMDYMMTGRSISPTDLGSPELKPGRRLQSRCMESKKPERPVLRRSKRSSVLSSLMSSPPLTHETSCIKVVPRAETRAMSSSTAPRRASKRLVKPIKCEVKCNRSPTASKQLKKKRKTKPLKDTSASLSSTQIDRSLGSMLTSMDSGIAMSFQDSNVSQTSPNKEDDIFALRAQSSTEESCPSLFQWDEPKISTHQSSRHTNPIRKLKSSQAKKLMTKPPRTSKQTKTGKGDDQHINQWASKINHEFSEIEMFDLVIST